MKDSQISFEYILFLLVLLITAFGVINMFSASTSYTNRVYNDVTYLLFKQLTFVALGVVLCLITNFIHTKFIIKISKYAYYVTILLVIATILVGTMSRGSMRWFTFRSIRFQPSELMKLSLIMYMASFIKKNMYMLNINNNMPKLFLLGFLPAAIIAINNLSTGIIIFTITMCILFLVSEKKFIFLLLVFVGVFIYVFSYQIATIFKNTGIIKSYQLNRILAWKKPLEYRDLTYQILQGLYAIGSGGLFGRGFGQSIQKSIIPEAHNDMVFTIICEELGFVGSMVLILLYILIIIRIFYISYKQDDIYALVVCFGIGIHLSLQVILNLSVVMNLIPNTGITLPFVSYGGSSLVVSYIEIGLIMNFSRSCNV